MALVYLTVTMVIMVGFASLAVDVGHCQLVKTEMRRAADAVAHDLLVTYNSNGTKTSSYTYSSSSNPITMSNNSSPTFTITWGYWHSSSSTFNSTSAGGTVAVRVTVSCTRANGNAIPLTFGPVVGQSTIDMTVSSTAALSAAQSANVTVSAQSNPYFAGMPSTTTDIYGDTNSAGTQGATQVTAITVTPGQWLTFTSVGGTTTVVSGTAPYVGPNGYSSGNGTAVYHGVDWSTGTGTPTTENGIADARMPDAAFMGLFLGSSAPDLTAAPSSVVDWTTAASQAQTTISNLTIKQPFFIGDGKSSGGTVQQFKVPPGATRLFVGIWDGQEYNNNAGSDTATINTVASISIVQ